MPAFKDTLPVRARDDQVISTVNKIMGWANTDPMVFPGSVSVGGGLTVTGRAVMMGTNTSPISTATPNQGNLEVQATGGGASMISFHRPGAYAAYFGIDTDNVWRVGGWSAGANAYRLILGDGFPAASNGSINVGQVNASYVVCEGGDIGAGPLYFRHNGSYYIQFDNVNTFQAVNMNILSWGWVGLAGNANVYMSWNGARIAFTHGIDIAGVSLTTTTARGYGALTTTSGQGDFVLGGAASILYMHPNFTVGIEQASPYCKFFGNMPQAGSYYYVPGVSTTWDGTYIRPSHSLAFNTAGNQIVWPNGSYISGNAGYAQGSNPTLKLNAAPAPDEALLGLVADPRMAVQTYLWADNPNPRARNIGFMADDVATVLPDHVIRDSDGRPSGYNPQELATILWGAVRALNAKVDRMEAAA